MAQGLAVLEAALAGRGVRLRLANDGMSPWLTWCRSCHTFEERESLHGLPSSSSVTVWSLWHDTWEVEDPIPQTFADAVTAMDAGYVVARRGETTWRWRNSPSGHGYQVQWNDGDRRRWSAGHFTYEDIHATDWQVVADSETEDRETRPTIAEVAERLRREGFKVNAEEMKTIKSVMPTAVGWVAVFQQLAVWYPGLFREEDEE